MNDNELKVAVADEFDGYYNSVFDGADPCSQRYAEDVIDLVKRAFRPAEDYLEIHFEVVRILTMNNDYYLDQIEESTQKDKGTGGLWTLAKRITDQAIKDFDDGLMVWHDFIEELNNFVDNFKI